MIILGLTGSIGMGKSETARMFRRLGVPVFDSDAAVHQLMAPNGAAIAPITDEFGDVLAEDGSIDRAKLGAVVFGDGAALKKLESILHPMVSSLRQQFLQQQTRYRTPIVVFDVPLLFETGGEKYCHYTVVVSAPDFVQRSRVLARPGMTEERLAAILAKQMPDREKRNRADFIIQSGNGKAYAFQQVRSLINEVK